MNRDLRKALRFILDHAFGNYSKQKKHIFRIFRLFGSMKKKTTEMMSRDYFERPSKAEQLIAMESYEPFLAMLDSVKTDTPEIEIEETGERIRIPLSALRLLAKILKETSQGKTVSILPLATDITTQAAADILGCSRPHLIKLLESGVIKFTKIGKHRRIKYQDILDYKNKLKAEQRKLLIEIMKADEESELYDS